MRVFGANLATRSIGICSLDILKCSSQIEWLLPKQHVDVLVLMYMYSYIFYWSWYIVVQAAII